MFMKRYTIAAVLLIALVGWYIYVYVTQDKMSLEVYGTILPSLPIAVWIIIPLIVLYIGTMLHMFIYSFLGGLKLRKYTKDYNKLIDAIADAYLAKAERNAKYKTTRYKLLGSIINSTNLFPTSSMKAVTQHEKLDSVIEMIDNIKNGEVVDLKKYDLKPQNDFVVQNERNRYKKGDLTAGNILSSSGDYNSDFVREVYVDFVKTAPINTIEQNKDFLTREALFIILARINSGENSIEVSNETLISLFNVLKLDAKDLIEVSAVLSHGMIPEQRMKLFEILSESRQDALEAYLYTLFDLEMIAAAKEILDASQKDEYLNFKAYATLKDCGKNFNINIFV